MTQKKLKVGIFTASYLPYISGVVRSVVNFKEGLEELGHEVYVFTQEFPGHRSQEENVFFYKSIKFKTGQKIKYPLPIPISPRIDKIIKRLNLDIIHVQHPYIIGELGLHYSRKLNIPCVFTYHTLYDKYTHYLPLVPRKISAKLAKIMAVNFCNKCHSIICPSESLKEHLKKESVRKPLYVLPTPVHFEKIREVNQKIEFNLPKKAKIILHVGRLAKEKNVEFLLESFKKVFLELENIFFVIVGSGPDENRLKEFSEKLGIANSVIFAGEVNPQEVFRYYKSSDLFIFSSKTETQGLVILEAMASGLPVVAVDAVGAKDIIENGVDGILTKDNLEDFSSNVLGLLKNKKRQEEISLNAIKKAEKYSLSNLSRKLVELYQETINSFY